MDQEDANGCVSPSEEDDLSSSGETPRGSWASLDLRHSQHDPLLPSLLDRVCLETIDQMNEQKRLEDRQVKNYKAAGLLGSFFIKYFSGSLIPALCSSDFS